MLHSLDVATEFPSIQYITAIICKFRIASNVRLKCHFRPVLSPFHRRYLLSAIDRRVTNQQQPPISVTRNQDMCSVPEFSNNIESLDKCLHGLSTKDSDVGNPAPRTVAGHRNFTSRTARNSAREVTNKRFVHTTFLDRSRTLNRFRASRKLSKTKMIGTLKARDREKPARRKHALRRC